MTDNVVVSIIVFHISKVQWENKRRFLLWRERKSLFKLSQPMITFFIVSGKTMCTTFSKIKTYYIMQKFPLPPYSRQLTNHRTRHTHPASHSLPLSRHHSNGHVPIYNTINQHYLVSKIKGTGSRNGYFVKGLFILIFTFCVCADGFQGLSKAFHYPIQLLTCI